MRVHGLGLLLAILAAGFAPAAQAQHIASTPSPSEDHKGWIDVQSVGLGVHKPGSGSAASGDVTFSTALSGTAPPSRLEFDVEVGALPRELARAHRERSVLGVTVRGWDPDRKLVRTCTLHDVYVKKYQGGSTGARVVIETGPPAGPMRTPTRSN